MTSGTSRFLDSQHVSGSRILTCGAANDHANSIMSGEPVSDRQTQRAAREMSSSRAQFDDDGLPNDVVVEIWRRRIEHALYESEDLFSSVDVDVDVITDDLRLRRTLE